MLSFNLAPRCRLWTLLYSNVMRMHVYLSSATGLVVAVRVDIVIVIVIVVVVYELLNAQTTVDIAGVRLFSLDF